MNRKRTGRSKIGRGTWRRKNEKGVQNEAERNEKEQDWERNWEEEKKKELIAQLKKIKYERKKLGGAVTRGTERKEEWEESGRAIVREGKIKTNNITLYMDGKAKEHARINEFSIQTKNTSDIKKNCQEEKENQ